MHRLLLFSLLQAAPWFEVMFMARGRVASCSWPMAGIPQESWQKQARLVAAAGFRVLVFETLAGAALRQTGKETDCLYDPECMAIDVIDAVRFLRRSGATSISVIAGSAGGGAAAQASVGAISGEIDRLVLLAPMVIAAPEKMKGRKLFIAARDDRDGSGSTRLEGIRRQYDQTSDPKELIILEGSAHAQRIFDTADGDRIMREIVRFISAP
jgi:predicted alpha/beta-hydrolase family hydrolase